MANPHLTYEGGSCRLEAGSWDNNKSESGRTLEHRRPVRIKDTVEGAAYSVQRWLYHDERSVSERLVDSRMSGPKPNQLRIAARVEQMLKPMNSSHRSDSAFSMESHETDESASDTSIDAASSNLQAMSLETPPKPIEGVVIEELMKWFKIWLRERLPPTGNSDGDTQTAPKQGESSSSGAKRKASSSSRARNNSNRDQSNKRTKKDNDQDRAGKATAGDPAKRLDARRFACPFYKHDPREYSRHQWKYCVHPGWETVHRIKEHIYRCHMLPRYQCRRCFGDLETEAALNTHSRMPIACTPPPPDTPNRQYGINDTQERDLKSKKRAGTHKTEEDKWRDVYKICFPDDEPIPDPYQEYPHETRLMTKYQDFLAREIPTHVRRRLQGLPTTLSESDLRNQIPQMVSELVNQLYHSFRNQITQQRAEAAPAVHAQSIGSNGYLASVTGTQVSLEMPTGSALQPSWEQNLANGHEDASSEWDEIFNWEFDL